MNIFKKKSLCAALAGIGALGAAGAAQAVNLNPDGLGQVLLYPYYTTRADAAGNVYNSLLSVVNTTASTKAVKVRFIEGRNSVEVLDFNLFLSPNDVWTAAITPTAEGAAVSTSDKSCTLPPVTTVDFRNNQYSGAADDGAGTSLDRTREGYVEIIEMATYSPTSDTAVATKHVGGVPPGCDTVAERNALNAAATSEALPPGGGLMGGMTLVNVQAGSDYTADAVALDGFSEVQLYSDPDSIAPNLGQANPPISVVFNNTTVFTSFWGPGTYDAVSAVLMHDQVMNEYVLESSTKAATDLIVTMPTKRGYVSVGTGTPAVLFQRNFGSNGACDDVSLDIFNREENSGAGEGSDIDFSPRGPGAPANALCWEANVITFNADTTATPIVSRVFGSVNAKNITTSHEHGWLNVGFLPASVTGNIHKLVNSASTFVQPLGVPLIGPVDATYVGLPVIGFVAHSYVNEAVTVNGSGVPIMSTYGGNFVNKGSRRVD